MENQQHLYYYIKFFFHKKKVANLLGNIGKPMLSINKVSENNHICNRSIILSNRIQSIF